MNATIVICTEMVNLRLLPKFLHRNGVMLRYAPIRLNFLLFVSCISLLVSYICMTSCYDVSVLFLFLAMISSITNTYIIMPS